MNFDIEVVRVDKRLEGERLGHDLCLRVTSKRPRINLSNELLVLRLNVPSPTLQLVQLSPNTPPALLGIVLGLAGIRVLGGSRL
eukprot:5053981-Pyramimonas_sp.AAC.1